MEAKENHLEQLKALQEDEIKYGPDEECPSMKFHLRDLECRAKEIIKLEVELGIREEE